MLSPSSHCYRGKLGVGILHVVLHPAVVPVETERVGEMNVCSDLSQDIAGPVPTTGGLEDDLGMLAGGRHRPGQGDRIVLDPVRLQALAVLVCSDDQ